VSEYEKELRALGYRRLGYLAKADDGYATWAIFNHPGHPTYALLTAESIRGGRRVVLSLESFWEGGGRLTSTSASIPRFEAGLETEPRLVQLRIAGTATALDGQHVGTLRAWQGGGREPLPATKEALPDYLATTHQAHRRQGEKNGWLPLGVYTQVLFRHPPRTLRF
jgi:hypothetical protein